MNKHNNLKKDYMKTYIHSIFALAIAACAFIACGDDVDQPENYNQHIGQAIYEPAGAGTAEDPFNVAGLANELKDITGVTAKEYYVRGYVCSVAKYNDQYGAINYYISDHPKGKSTWFYVYSGLGLNKDKFTAITDLKVGTEVVICGKGTTYQGSLQLDRNSYIVLMNGKDTPEGWEVFEPTGSGSSESPYNVTGVIEATKNLESGKTTTEIIYTHGYVSSVASFNSKYNSLSYYITDSQTGKSAKFYVYSGQGLNNTKFSGVSDLKAGDEVVVCGKITNYNGTIEYQSQNYIVKLNGKTE